MKESAEYIPVSYLNAYVYCPRRFYLERVLGMFEDNAHTIEGRSRHRVVDMRDREARPVKKEEVIHRRSVSFSSERLGIIGKLDLVEEKDGAPGYPVEYKKAKKPANRDPWLNDQIQLCAQALLMRENGLTLPERAYIYYIGSRARVEVPLTPDLVAETERVIEACRQVAATEAPPPLTENRNKCFGCSLNAICLPEEEEVLAGKKSNAREILPSALDGDVLYVDTIGAYLSLSQDCIKITAPGGMDIGSASLEKLREVVLCGPVQATTQVLHSCLKRHVPIHYMSQHGRYLGHCTSWLHHHGLLREAQWRTHFDPGRALELARIIVGSKATNMRTLMMRYLKDDRNEGDAIDFERIKDLKKKGQTADNLDTLRGYEGAATRVYFGQFARYIKPERRSFFPFDERNRRPPRDPVNAMLSFGYSLLAKDCQGTGGRVGFDPYCGFYHTMKYGRPSLALDIMEFFRQPIVDSMVISSINNGIFKENDFLQYQNTCYLNEKGRKKFLAQYEMRKKDLVTHPRFHYRLSYERTIELQFRLLGKFLLGQLPEYEGFHIR
ncbi:MAG: CRISPR-associated endonuclease Cas1 [Deltaproteobacteria bacterium]|nr:CRISPR-associated endonuclease Cas1 [Deltaproteobacteria bacterium]